MHKAAKVVIVVGVLIVIGVVVYFTVFHGGSGGSGSGGPATIPFPDGIYVGPFNIPGAASGTAGLCIQGGKFTNNSYNHGCYMNTITLAKDGTVTVTNKYSGSVTGKLSGNTLTFTDSDTQYTVTRQSATCPQHKYWSQCTL